MRRILLLVTDLEIGGTPTVVREVALRLNRAADVHVEVACLGRWGPVATQISDGGVDVTALDACSPADVRVVWRLIDLIRERRIDTILSFLVHANAVAAAGATLAGGVRLFQSIQTTQERPEWHWRVQGIIEPTAERIIVPTESVARAAEERSGIAKAKIVVIPNGVEVGEFEGIAMKEGKELAAVGFIGRLDPVKRVPDLLGAMKLLRGRAHLHVFGEGGERGRIEAEIARLGIARWVTMHGAVARPQEALQQIDLLALPSEAEGFGLVLIEAMAAGIPVVATDAPGIRDVVRDGQTGLLVAVGDVEGLAGAIRRVLDDAALRERLVQRARRDVRERFSWGKVIEQYRCVLEL